MNRRLKFLLPCVLFSLLGPGNAVADSGRFPDFAQIRQVAGDHFAELRRGPNDLITREEVRALLAAIGETGWRVPDQEAILSRTLPASHPLVRTLSTKQGRQFSSKVSSYKLIFDRMERISGVPGGQQLLQDLVKLPDGHRYAKRQTRGAVPDLVALLPKQRNGKKRQVPKYNQPTGNLYTPSDVLAHLHESYRTDTEGD